MFSKELIAEIERLETEIESSRTLPTSLLKLAYKEKLFKLFVPKELGGKMLSLPEAVKVFERASELDGSFGWLVTIGSGGNMFVPNFEKEQCEILFSPENAVIAGSGQLNGRASKVADGYVVTGEWKYCSGANYATIFTANAVVEGTDEFISCIFSPEQVEVVDDWRAFGLKGTGSNTIKVSNAFVPLEKTFLLTKVENEYGGLVHTFPFIQFSQSSFAGVCVGIAQRFFEEASIHLNNSVAKESENFTRIASDLIRTRETFEKTVAKFHQLLNEVWVIHEQGNELSEAKREKLSQACKQVAATAIALTSDQVRKIGMAAIHEEFALNRAWRNLYTAGQHVFLKE